MHTLNISSNMFFYLSLSVLLYIRYKLLCRENKEANYVRELMTIILGVYLIKVISLVFFPIVLQIGVNIVNKNPIIFLNPIKSWIFIIKNFNIYGIVYNILGNLVLLIPLPILLIYFYRNKVDSILKIFIICLITSIGIESFQYIESILISGVQRFIETNDVILNTSGGVLGYLLYDRYLRKIF